MSAETDVAAYLVAEGIGALGTNLFTGPVRPVTAHVPADSLFVLSGGGPAAQRYLSGGKQVENRHPSVQVTIRNVDYDVGKSKAMDVHNALQAASITGYWDVKVIQSEPLFGGYDNDTYRWSVNCELSHSEENWHA